MLDQSPHQLARARAKPALADCAKLLGDAEQLPFEDDSVRPLRVGRQHRVLARPAARRSPRPTACCAPAARRGDRPGRARQPRPRALAETWMLFPRGGRVPRVVRARRASTDVRVARARAGLVPRALAVRVAISGASAARAVAGAPRAAAAPRRRSPGRARFAGRFVARLRRRRRCSCRSAPCWRCARGCGGRALMTAAAPSPLPARAAGGAVALLAPAHDDRHRASVAGLFTIVVAERRRAPAASATCSGRWWPPCR